MFLDVDYPDLIRHKSKIISETPAFTEQLRHIFGEGSVLRETMGEIRNDSYSAVGCDLTDIDLFDKVLRRLYANLEQLNILFISEVAITYMVSS